MSALYGSSPTTERRTRADIASIERAMIALLQDEHPMTVRQVFYRLVSAGVIRKTEGEYKRTVVRLLTNLRRAGAIPYDWLADSTRWMHKQPSYASLEQMLSRSAALYRGAFWDNQDAYVEIWLEKEALAGVVFESTALWDVPLMVTRGYPSLSFLHGAAATIAAQAKPAFIYYLGDHDPSGRDISRAVEEGIRDLAPDADLAFTRVAVEPWQIAAWNLPTRPTKTTDSRAKHFQGESVEVDAIPPVKLKDLVSQCICRDIDDDAQARLEAVEDAERATLQNLAGWVARGKGARGRGGG